MDRKISISVPLNLSHFITANGFHPLYEPYLKDNDTQYYYLDEFRLSYSNCNFQDSEYKDVLENSFICKVDKEYNNEELIVQNFMPGEVEFIHTVPFFSIKKPSIFHCESFVPIFMPLAFQGSPNRLTKLYQYKEHYRELFSSNNCLVIGSHLRTTLENFKTFFDDEKINEKLVYTKPCLAERYFYNTPIVKEDKTLRFLYTNSAHQNSSSYKLRGGAIVEELLTYCVTSNIRSIFYFRFNVDHSLKSRLSLLVSNSCVSIVWIDKYLSDNDLKNLLLKCDFFLLPSVNLHTMSIMQACAAGCIPIVTDTLGVEEVLEDFPDEFILKGVRQHVWKQSELGFLIDDHSVFFELTLSLSKQICKIVAGYANNLDSLQAKRESIRNFARKKFSIDLTIRNFLNYAERVDKIEPKSLKSFRSFAINNLDKNIFETPVQPYRVLNTTHGSIFLFKALYWVVPKNRLNITGSRRYWSSFSKYGQNFGYVFKEYSDAVEKLLEDDFPKDHGMEQNESRIKRRIRKQSKKYFNRIVNLFKRI